MKEDLLHMVWKMKKFDFGDLRTTKDEPISIINFGNHNHDSGPDFLNAEINIGHTKWFGHVEIHVKASEWTQHKHQHDPNYNNVILHVVYEHDVEIFDVHNKLG